MKGIVSFFSTYIFLLSALYFLLWGIALFISFRKEKAIQKKILIMSALFALLTPFIEHLNLSDWWSPTFLWNTFFHAEDLLFGFAITSTTLGVYFWISKSVRAKIERQAIFSPLYKTTLLIAEILLTFIAFYLAHVPSFYAMTVCAVILSGCVFARVPAMIVPAVVTGIFITLIILPGYFIGTYLHPGWIQEYWRLAGWPGRLLLTIPIGEYIFYLFSGLFIPAFAEALFAKARRKA